MPSWLWLSLVLLASWIPSRVLAGSCGQARLCCTGRDSSCVVQREPHHGASLGEQGDHSGAEDKPCYCDHACLKLGDCCPDFKDACGVLDCQVSTWGQWSSCDAECGPGAMARTRKVLRAPEHGGRHCPGLVQRRACQGAACPRHTPSVLRETAMLLPAALSHSRKINETEDITKNLRLRNPNDSESTPHKEYCVEFEVIKASKACRKETPYKALQEGSIVCVRCETSALRRSLFQWRCPGGGAPERATRFSALPAPHCRGKWLRLTPEEPTNTTQPSCRDTCRNQAAQFIFV